MFVHGKSRQFNVFLWVTLIFGTGVLMCLYSMEWYARINCPPVYVSCSKLFQFLECMGDVFNSISGLFFYVFFMWFFKVSYLLNNTAFEHSQCILIVSLSGRGMGLPGATKFGVSVLPRMSSTYYMYWDTFQYT